MGDRASRVVAGLWVSIAVAGSAAAHDFWIEPSAFRPAAGAHVAVALRVGEGFSGDPVPRRPERIVRFALIGPGGERPLAGRDGGDPAGLARIPLAGLHAVVYQSSHAEIELEAAKFEDYLREEGLERIVALRAARGQTDRPGREIFARCAKTLLGVGDAPATGADRPAGMPLELVAERNPYALAPGDALPLRLLFRGAPIAGVRIDAVHGEAPERVISARSDADGRVRLTLDRAGAWLITAVHMIDVAIDAPARARADWESLWASLTFELPAGGKAAGDAR